METKHAASTGLKITYAVLAVLFLASLGFFVYDNVRAGSEPWQVIVSTIMLSIPLLLLFGCIALLVNAGEQMRTTHQISPRLARTIYLAPRIAGILITVFLLLFSFDVFEMGGTVWQQIGAFIMHSIPAIVMAIALAFAWRWPIVGFVGFLLAGLFFMRTLLFNPIQGIGNFLIFAGPMLVIALLFFVNWRWKKGLRPAR